MKLVKVDQIKERYVPYGMLQSLITEFLKSDAKMVQIVFGEHEYKDSQSCYSSFYKAIKRSGYAGVRVVTRSGKVYLVKEVKE